MAVWRPTQSEPPPRFSSRLNYYSCLQTSRRVGRWAPMGAPPHRWRGFPLVVSTNRPWGKPARDACPRGHGLAKESMALAYLAAANSSCTQHPSLGPTEGTGIRGPEPTFISMTYVPGHAYLLQGPSTTGNKPPSIERIERIEATDSQPRV
jgi:hypothetical protein